MKVIASLLFVVALVAAHTRVQDNAGISIRNDQEFSVSGPCGGVAAYGANGITDVTAGDSITIVMNYGTGANGDHADAGNVFRAVLLCDSPDESAFVGQTGNIGGTVAAPGGSRPNGYTFTFTLPTDQTGACAVSVMDQRNWGGCLDMNIAAAVNAGSGSGSSLDADGAKKSGSGSGGLIAGLVIGGVVLVAAGAGYYYYKQQNGGGVMSGGYSTNSNAGNFGGNSGNNNFGGNNGNNNFGGNQFSQPQSTRDAPPRPNSFGSAPPSQYGPPRPNSNNFGGPAASYGAPPPYNNAPYGAPQRPASSNAVNYNRTGANY